MTMKKMFGAVAIGVVLCLTLCACGSGVKESFSPTRAYRTEIAPDYEPLIDGPITIDPPGDIGREKELRQEMQNAFTVLNEARAKQGLSQLRWDQALEAGAHVRAIELIDKFDNETRPDGSYWYTAAYPDALGENVYAGKSSANEVMSAWLESANDKENFMCADFTRVGFGIEEDENGTCYWAVMFGK